MPTPTQSVARPRLAPESSSWCTRVRARRAPDMRMTGRDRAAVGVDVRRVVRDLQVPQHGQRLAGDRVDFAAASLAMIMAAAPTAGRSASMKGPSAARGHTALEQQVLDAAPRQR